eukprot:TRINITY_DN2132_c0_g3_i10.p1 TRINITY_DN2132_c0_g3~~TRINITY_DN2132_c0_g3_i10.p1  ORF type:complete len:1057 (+),score=224.53 TRINITY_DN2132_c0_g3_i10:186-3173(+)
MAAKRALSEAQSKEEQLKMLQAQIQELGKELESRVGQCQEADNRLNITKQQYEERMWELQRSNDALSQQNAQLSHTNQNQKQQIIEISQQINSNQASAQQHGNGNTSELEFCVEEMKQSLKSLEEENVGLKGQLQQFQSMGEEKEAYMQQIQLLQSQLKEAKEDSEYNYEMAGKLKQAMIELDAKAVEQFEEAVKQKVEVEGKYNLAKGKINDLKMKNGALDEMVQSLKTQLERMTDEQIKLNQQVEENKSGAYENFQKERTQMQSEIEKLRGQFQGEQERASRAENEVGIVNMQLQENKTLLQELQNKANMLSAKNEEMSEELRSCRIVIEESTNKHSKQVEDLEARIQELQLYNKNGAQTLKEREQMIVGLQETVHKLNLKGEELQQEGNGLRDQIVDRDEQLSQLKGNISQLEMNKQVNEATIEKLREEIRNVVDGTHLYDSNVSSLQRKVSELELELAQTSKNMTLLQRERKETVARYDATVRCLKEDLEAKQQIIQYFEKESQASERNIQDFEFRIQELETQKQSITATCESLELQVQTQTTQRHLLEKKNSDLLCQLKDKEDQLAMLERNLEELDIERMDLIRVMNATSAESKRYKERVRQLESQIGGLKGDQADLDEQTGVYQLQLKEREEVITGLRGEISLLKDRLEESRQKSLEWQSGYVNAAVIQEKELEIKQLQEELTQQKQSNQTLSQQLQQEQERFGRELSILGQQAKALTPQRKKSFDISHFQSLEIINSPHNDTISDLEKQRELLQRLCDNLTQSNHKLTQKNKEVGRKLKLVNIKYENMKKYLQTLDIGSVPNSVGREESMEMSPISNNVKSNSQEKQEGEKEEGTSEDENIENKEPNLLSSKKGRVSSVDVIPESPFADEKCMQTAEKVLSRRIDDSELSNTGDGKQSTPDAPSRKQHRVSQSPVNAKSASLLEKPLNDKENDCKSKNAILNSAPPVYSQQELENESFASRRLSFPTQFSQEEERCQGVATDMDVEEG